jgi:hypothetical protein
MISLLTKITALEMERNETERHNEIWDYRSTLGFDTWPGSGFEFSRIKLLDTYRDTTFEAFGESDG